MPESFERGALTEATYLILLSVYEEPKHGYGIMQFIKEITNDRVELGAGTLYGALNNLLEKAWIIQVSNELSKRKKEYVITDLGKTVILNEMNRLNELINIGENITRGK